MVTGFYTRKDTLIYDHACCRVCGTGWGGKPGGHALGHVCDVSECMACGSRVCQSHGLGRGSCPVCYIGILTGWSGSNRTCGYKRCSNPAVAEVGGLVKNVCMECIERPKVHRMTAKAYIAKRVEERAEQWLEVDRSTYRARAR